VTITVSKRSSESGSARVVSLRLPSELRAHFAAAISDAQAIVLHSASRAVGPIAGGAESIARAILDTCAGRTLVVPTFTPLRTDPSTWTSPPVAEELFDVIRDELPLFDPDWSPPWGMGRIVDLVWRAPGALRSFHPVESVAAVGPLAASIVKPHPLDDPMGPRSPWARLVELDAVIVLLGVGLERCSMLHHAERMAEVPYVDVSYAMPVALDGDRTWIEVTSGNNCSEGFPRLERSLRRAGLVRDVLVGDARTMVLSSRALVEHARAALAADPAALLCEQDDCLACEAARRMLGSG